MKNILIVILILMLGYYVFIHQDKFEGKTAVEWSASYLTLQIINNHYENDIKIYESCTKSFFDDERFRPSLTQFKSYDHFWSFCNQQFAD